MSQLGTTKSILLSLGFLAAIGFAPTSVPDSHAFGLGGGTAGDVKSEQAIRDLYTEFVKDWNKHDVAAMSGRWSVDGDHVEPDGTVAKGKEDVTALFTAQHGKGGVFADSNLQLTVKSVWMISDTIALVDAAYTLTGAKLPSGTVIPAREGMLTAILLQEKSTWAIVASRLMIPTTLPYKKAEAAAAE